MYVPYIFKEISRRKSRTLTSVLTVAVIIAMLISVTVIMNAYTSAIYLPFKDIDSDLILQKSHESANLTSGIRMPFGMGTFSDDELMKISSLDHVKDVSGSLILWDFNKKGFTSIEGLDVNSAVGMKLGSWVNQGSFITDGDDKKAVLESHFAKFNRLKVGDEITVGGETFSIAGILKIGEGSPIFASNVYVKSSDAHRISDINGYNQIYLKVDDISSEEEVKAKIGRLDPRITAISGNYISASLKNVVDIYGTFYWVGVGIMALITLLVLFKVNAMALLERKREIAVLQSVGWTREDIIKQILIETSLQTALGFILGAVASFAVIAVLGKITIQGASAGLESTPTIIAMPLDLSSGIIAIYFGLTAVISLLVSYLLARQTAAIKPSDNLRSL